MRTKSRRYLAVHLRFEPDMLAFSGCYYGGERRELGAIRRRWKTLSEADLDPERRHGKCPSNSEEVGLLLRAVGFGNDSYLYVASGEVYGGEETLRPLKVLFQNFYTKYTLSNRGELEPFSLYSSRMAALDYIVCDQSDVFVTNNNGNKEMMAIGLMNIAGSCTSSYVTTGSFSRSAVNYNAGCNSVVSNVVMALTFMVTLLLLTPLFYYTSRVVLASIIVAAVLGLIDFPAAYFIWKSYGR